MRAVTLNSACASFEQQQSLAATEAQCGLLTVNKTICVSPVLEKISALSVSIHSYIGERLSHLSYKLVVEKRRRSKDPAHCNFVDIVVVHSNASFKCHIVLLSCTKGVHL